MKKKTCLVCGQELDDCRSSTCCQMAVAADEAVVPLRGRLWRFRRLANGDTNAVELGKDDTLFSLQTT